MARYMPLLVVMVVVSLTSLLSNVEGAASCKNPVSKQCPAKFTSAFKRLAAASTKGGALYVPKEPATFYIASSTTCLTGSITKVTVKASPINYKPKTISWNFTTACPGKASIRVRVSDKLYITWNTKSVKKIDAWIVNYKKSITPTPSPKLHSPKRSSPRRPTPEPSPAPGAVTVKFNSSEVIGNNIICEKEIKNMFSPCGPSASAPFDYFADPVLSFTFATKKCTPIKGYLFNSGSIGNSIGGNWKGRPWALWVDNVSLKPILLFQFDKTLKPGAVFKAQVPTSVYCAQLITVTKGCLTNRQEKSWCGPGTKL